MDQIQVKFGDRDGCLASGLVSRFERWFCSRFWLSVCQCLGLSHGSAPDSRISLMLTLGGSRYNGSVSCVPYHPCGRPRLGSWLQPCPELWPLWVSGEWASRWELSVCLLVSLPLKNKKTKRQKLGYQRWCLVGH